jgi:hypothetical protein
MILRAMTAVVLLLVGSPMPDRSRVIGQTKTLAGWGFGVRITTSHCKTFIVHKPRGKPDRPKDTSQARTRYWNKCYYALGSVMKSKINIKTIYVKNLSYDDAWTILSRIWDWWKWRDGERKQLKEKCGQKSFRGLRSCMGKTRPRRDANHSPKLVPRSRMSSSYTSIPPWRLHDGSGTALLLSYYSCHRKESSGELLWTRQ